MQKTRKRSRLTDFCAFILTHGRPDSVYTYETIRKAGYTGPIYIIVDDEDAKREEYVARFGAQVLTFSKAEIAKTFDEGDNFNDRRAIIYARNACFHLARELGFTYFIQLDDDYTAIRYKMNDRGEYDDGLNVKSLDVVLAILLEYYKSIPALAIAMAQGGDFLGGKEGNGCSNRKCMNSFICSTERPFSFFGRLNEDVNVYTNLARRGELFLTMTTLAIEQRQTQSNAGGMTEVYRDSGTYVKSFYTVMYSPSCVRISEMLSHHRRIHHKIKWAHTAPMIVDERHRKAR
jgi:TET-associated glycosyltransferase-like protein